MKKLRLLSKRNIPGIERQIHAWHEEVFGGIDCTACGLCCRNMGPIFRNTDVKHVCAAIGADPKRFHADYLQQDPDGVGFMLRELPCPFQNADNTCSIYDVRTLSCVNFPHTNSVNIRRKLGGLALDSLYCPAAFMICEKIMETY